MSTRYLKTWQEQAALALAGQEGDEDAWVALEKFKLDLRKAD